MVTESVPARGNKDRATRVVVLGGAENQMGCIAAARRLGADVTVVDPRPDVPGRWAADSWIQLDAASTPEIVSALAGVSVDAVVSDQSDYTARASATLAAALGVKGQDLALIDACTNKYSMRRRLHSAVPDLIPAFRHFDDPGAALSYALMQEAPQVVKPVQSQGSRGVRLLRPGAERDLVERAFALSDDRGVLVEQAIFGREYSVDGYVSNGELLPLAISAKSQYSGNECLDERLDFLRSLYAEAEGPLVAAVRRIVAALGISFGIIHAELFAEGNDVTLVEIALRGGGSAISSVVVPYLTSFDPAEALLRDLLSLPSGSPPTYFGDRSAILRFLPAVPLPTVDPRRDPSNKEWLSLVVTNASAEGTPSSSDDRAGFIVLGANTEAAALEAERVALLSLGYRAEA